MKPINYFGLVGSLMIIAGALSPMLRVPVMGNWNYYDLHVTLASIVMTLAALGVVASLINKPGLLKFCGWAALIVILLTLLAVYFKVNDAFSFIPFKKLAAAAVRLVKYKWTGWLIMLAGTFLVIVGGRKKNSRIQA
jgi:hypothetical protein